ncbi:tetratricopeptide repeat protein [Pseudomonas fluorescens]|uniref:Uncharacterized protein n=1 Tax=Pseudomonas fluorescens TaxID=294 RepID=A0A0F4VB72_PSEFL|nr:hypothetical protein [Pseudomonas fluorescens]KJZ66016.1 hypothetical protein VD17_11155 [Pseudomonas fluorescens]
MNFKGHWLFVFLLLASSAWGESKKLTCDPDTNICSVSVPENFCGSEGLPKSKWDIRSQSYILSCECDCTAQENSFWFIDKNGSVQTLEASKVVSGLDIARNKSGIPDAFGVVPYCQPVKVDANQLIYLQKVPSVSGQPQPYCYSTLKYDEAQVCTTSDCVQKQKLVASIAERLKEESLAEFKNATSRLYKSKRAFVDFPKREFIERYVGDYGYSSANQQTFNDIGYFWQQAGFNGDAIWLLTKVLTENPKRIVAYLNIADAYWSEGDKAAAAKNYKRYEELMTADGKQQKIPERVKQRVAF